MSGQPELNFDDPAVRREWLRRLQSRADSGARKREIPFNLPFGLAEELYKKQQGRCAVSGFKFDLQRFSEALVKHPFAPSIDRKLSNGGYTPENVRLVCVAVNFGMGEWGEEVFLTLPRAAVEADKQKTAVATGTAAEWYAQQERRIAAAEAICEKLPPEEQARQRSRIRGLKAAKTKGPQYMSEIAFQAARTKRERGEQSTLAPRPPV